MSMFIHHPKKKIHVEGQLLKFGWSTLCWDGFFRGKEVDPMENLFRPSCITGKQSTEFHRFAEFQGEKQTQRHTKIHKKKT